MCCPLKYWLEHWQKIIMTEGFICKHPRRKDKSWRQGNKGHGNFTRHRWDTQLKNQISKIGLWLWQIWQHHQRKHEIRVGSSSTTDLGAYTLGVDNTRAAMHLFWREISSSFPRHSKGMSLIISWGWGVTITGREEKFPRYFLFLQIGDRAIASLNERVILWALWASTHSRSFRGDLE